MHSHNTHRDSAFRAAASSRQALRDVDGNKRLRQILSNLYEASLLFANELTNLVYSPVFGITAADWMRFCILSQTTQSAFIKTFSAALSVAIGLPTASELADLRAEIHALHDSIKSHAWLGDARHFTGKSAGLKNDNSEIDVSTEPHAHSKSNPISAVYGHWLQGVARTLDGLRHGLCATTEDPPPTTPYRVIFEHGKLRLRHYASKNPAHKTPILLVYALIKRPFVFDLQRGRSVIEQAGFDVFLTDWLPPISTDHWRGFDAYINGDLEAGVNAIRQITGQTSISILGYCFGALLSLAYAALYPSNVRNLITATVPFDMSSRELPVYNLVTHLSEETIDLIGRTYGNCPAWLIQMFFTAMAPMHHAIDKYVSLHRNAERAGYRETFELFERWMNSDVPFAGQIFKETMISIFKRNQLARGEFEIAGNKIDLSAITCPFLNLL